MTKKEEKYMSKRHLHRLLALLMAVVMTIGFMTPAWAAKDSQESDELVHLTAEKADADELDMADPRDSLQAFDTSTEDAAENADPNEVVRVSIVLEDEPTLEAGYDTEAIAANSGAMGYRAKLQSAQDRLCRKIETQVLAGEKLDVVWNLTLAANIISANVKRSDMDKIAALPEIKMVVEETRYTPDVVSVGGTYQPNTAVSGQMTGAQASWLEGYTGAGMRIAVIDTGLDMDHQSFDPQAFAYAIAQDEKENGKTYALMTEEDSRNVLTKLNAYGKAKGALTAEDLYRNEKVPFGYNYVDANLDVTHDNDNQGEHGSHVAGIAAANRYLKQGDAFVDALDTVHVAGAAPDAQLLIMKVFGASGGAFDSDIMAGIEDAILLGADSVNLSLGSAEAGTAKASERAYADIMAGLVNSGLVCVISAGNSTYWAEYTTNGNLYSDGVNFDTVGAPGSYDNAFTVASVDNDGLISAKLEIGGKSVVYSENLYNAIGSPYGNASMVSLDTSEDGSGTEREYLLIDGVGNSADYTGMDLTGKIVFCRRGEIDLVNKANNAAALGAKAIVIYNYEAGLITMDLSGYNYQAPVVFVSDSAAEIAKANGAKQTTEGGAEYYTGTLSVCGKETANYLQSEYLTMSSFSSWGVPGDLSLKPEISAPGGNIYSVNGGTTETDQYELMSGTSMAAPQVAGMAAQVQQYIQENGIEVSDLDSRGLTQALLMSTAVPMRSQAGNGNYYPVFQQGSGFANVQAAIQTPVYLTVKDKADGKVKVELGEDADRKGEYTFQISLNNLSSLEMLYKLSGSFFTQEIFTDNGVDYLGTNTTPLSPEVDFTVNGQSVVAADESLKNCDFNGDGTVNFADAQTLLDYVTGATEKISHADAGDIDGSGTVDTYDVHQMLRLFQGYVTVPANGSAVVTVTVSLSEADRKALEAYPVGAYLEGYVFAAAESVDDGVVAPTLSVPVFGYYGSWTEASMFDVADSAGPEETRAPYYGSYNANAVGVVYGDKSGTAYSFGGNPIMPDETYHPERNAINLERGDYFSGWKYAPIRNAASVRATATNTTTNTPLMDPVYGGSVPAAYYYYSIQSWIGTERSLDIGLQPDMQPGEHGELTLTAAPELYVDDIGDADWDSLGAGASKKVNFTIDNEAPVLDESSIVIDTEKNVLRLTAKDDQFLAGAILYDNTGRKILNRVTAPEDAQSGQSVTFEIPLGNISGYRFVIQVGDYASNYATYKLKETIGTPGPRPTRILFNTKDNRWFTVYPGSSYYWSSDIISDYATITPYAATAVGSYVYVVSDSGSLYVAPADDLDGLIYVCRLGYILRDLAYDSTTDRIYGVTAEGLLVSFDKMTGETAEHGYIGGQAGFTRTLAFDGEKFYCGKYKTNASDYSEYCGVYSFTLDTLASPELVKSSSSSYDNYNSEYQTMEYDPERKVVAWVAKSGYYVDYVEVDPVAATWTRANASLYNDVTGLFFPDWTADDSWTESKGIVERVAFERADVTVQQGYTAQLEVQILPWNLASGEKSVSYTSLNPDIATVNDKGLVTGLTNGTATIRVSAESNPEIYADCTVKVESLDVTVDGVLMDDTGAPTMYTWNLKDALRNWERTVALDSTYYTKCITEIPGADAFYLLTSTSGTMHKLGTADGKDLVPSTSSYYDNNYPLYDMAYSNVYSTEETDKVYAVRDNYLILPFDPMTETNWQARNLNAISVGIAVGGTEKISVPDYYGYSTVEYDSEVVYVLDSDCRIHRLNVYEEQSYYSSRTSFVASVTPTDLHVSIPTDQNYAGYTSMVVGSDGALYASIFNGSSNTLYRLTYDESIQRYVSTQIGNFGKDVWPAAILHVASNMAEVTAAPAPTLRYNEDTQSYQSIDAKAEPTGSLNSVDIHPDTDVSSEENVAVDPDAQTVTVPVMAEESTNGLFRLAYDASVLSLQDVIYGGVTLHSQAQKAGEVTLGYASEAPYTGLVAKLVFGYKDIHALTDTAFRFTLNQDGKELVEHITDFAVRIHTHTPGQAVHENETPATCTHGGSFDEVVYCSLCNAELSRETKTVDALGHTPGTAVRENEKPASCTESGSYDQVVYCTVCKAEVSRETVTIAPLGHDWDAPTYTWAEDYSQITASRVCKNDAAHTETEKGTVTSQVTKEATYDTEGEITYTAVFENAAFAAQTATAATPKLERPANPFTDVTEKDYFYDPVLWAVDNGVTNGTTATTFSPEIGCTRAQVVTFLWRAAGEPEAAAGSNPFSDVAENAYYYKAVLWAVEKGITKGTTETTFSPEETCTRAQIVTFLWRFNGAPAPKTGTTPFTDLAENAYYGDAVLWAVENGITKGTTETTFSPEENCTRAQVVTFLYRSMN